jgi:ferredoxin-type protein NapG
MLDIRQGIHAGTPLIAVEQIPCYLCMKCVEVCPTGTLGKISQEATRMGTAVINKFTCAAWAGIALCRTCYDVCPFKGRAIALHELLPVVVKDACTGCGLCTHACPITTDSGLKAINIEPPASSRL